MKLQTPSVPRSVEKSFLYALQTKDITAKARFLAMLYRIDKGNRLLNIKQLVARS